MYKLFTVLSLAVSSLLLTQCKSASSIENQEIMTLSTPSFASVAAHYNTYVAGVQGGGTGIEFYIPTEVATTITMEKIFFRESAGRLMKSNTGYVARFRTDKGLDQDVVMSNNANEEAVNTPPVVNDTFPFALTNDQAGLIYKDNGVVKYCILSNIKERDSKAYPQQRPRGNGY